MLFIEILCDLRFSKQRKKSFLKDIHIYPVSFIIFTHQKAIIKRWI